MWTMRHKKGDLWIHSVRSNHLHKARREYPVIWKLLNIHQSTVSQPWRHHWNRNHADITEHAWQNTTEGDDLLGNPQHDWESILLMNWWSKRWFVQEEYSALCMEQKGHLPTWKYYLNGEYDGGRIMIWAVFAVSGLRSLAIMMGKINSQVYKNLLRHNVGGASTSLKLSSTWLMQQYF